MCSTRCMSGRLRLSIPFRHVFASELDKQTRRVLRYNHKPGRIYRDMTKRKHLPPKVNIYTAGFPCQPFSSQGWIVSSIRGARIERSRQIACQRVFLIPGRQPPANVFSARQGFQTVRHQVWPSVSILGAGVLVSYPLTRPLYSPSLVRSHQRDDISATPTPRISHNARHFATVRLLVPNLYVDIGGPSRELGLVNQLMNTCV